MIGGWLTDYSHFDLYSFYEVSMVEWLHCSTHIYKILCSNLSIIIHGWTLDKSLTAKLSRMIHSCRANASSVSTLGRRGAGTAVCKKKKNTVEIGCIVDPNNHHSWPQRVINLWEVIISIIITHFTNS